MTTNPNRLKTGAALVCAIRKNFKPGGIPGRSGNNTTKKEKDRLAAQEEVVKKLTPLIEAATSEPKREIIRILIHKIAYLNTFIEELAKDTRKSGVVVQYDNGGGQSGIRVHPAAQIYTQYMKTLHASIKQLEPFLPDDAISDELSAFLSGQPS